jgi:hypothetical protein
MLFEAMLCLQAMGTDGIYDAHHDTHMHTLRSTLASSPGVLALLLSLSSYVTPSALLAEAGASFNRWMFC